MEKEELSALAQLLSAIKEGLIKLESAQKEQDSEQIVLIKKEILSLQKRVNELL